MRPAAPEVVRKAMRFSPRRRMRTGGQSSAGNSSGRMAGSSSNSQPLRFVVLREQKSRDALLPLGRGTAPIGRAPLVVAVLLQKGARDFDVGRAVQNMMVTAWNEGVINCPVGIQDR